MKYICKKCYKNFFERILLGGHTVQTVPKYIWMRHCPEWMAIEKVMAIQKKKKKKKDE